MANFVTRSMAEIAAAKPVIDRAKIEAATDEDIDRMIAEDPDTAPDFDTLDPIPSVRAVRDRWSMTQVEFAKFLNIPVKTLRNWEQDARVPDPIVLTFLRVIEREPEAVRRALTNSRLGILLP